MLWAAWVCLTGFVSVYFSFHSQVRLRFKLAAGLGEALVSGWWYSPGLPSENGFYCGSLCPLVSSS